MNTAPFDKKNTLAAVDRVLALSSEYVRQIYLPMRNKIAEDVGFLASPGKTIIDLGGGIGFHSLVATHLGMRAISVDIWRLVSNRSDPNWQANNEFMKIAADHGVKFIDVDLLKFDPKEYLQEKIDLVMSVDNIEHLHHSPQGIYKRLIEFMEPGGKFLLGAPNAANILKRFRLLFGQNTFAKLEDWYLPEQFYEHVREPIVDDLLYIGRDLDLCDLKIIGRNWQGYLKYGDKLKYFEFILQPFPTLCSDIYLLATKS